MYISGATIPADAKAPEPMQVGEGSLDDPALAPEARAVGGPPAGDHGTDPAPAHQAAVVIVGAVAEQPLGALSGPADAALDRPDRIDEGHQLGDVVALAAGDRHRQRDARGLDQQVGLEPRRARSTGLGPLRSPQKPAGHSPSLDAEAAPA